MLFSCSVNAHFYKAKTRLFFQEVQNAENLKVLKNELPDTVIKSFAAAKTDHGTSDRKTLKHLV